MSIAVATYENIVSFENSSATPLLNEIQEHGPKKVFEKIIHWDNGDRYERTVGERPWGDAKTYKRDGYVMAYHYGLEFISLYRVID